MHYLLSAVQIINQMISYVFVKLKLTTMKLSILQILWVVQFNWFQWLLVIIGTVLSGGVLVLTFWPALRDDDKRVLHFKDVIHRFK